MWIIVLDRSGSMVEDFSANNTVQLPNRSRQTTAGSKWEAAKEAVITELKSMKAADQVIVFVFNSEADLIFDDIAGNYDDLAQSLEEIEPDNGTSISNALTTVYNHVVSLQAPHVSVTVITDGLDEPVPAQAAAELLANVVSMIEVILIDPTEKGKTVADGIAQRGKVIVVNKADTFNRELDQAKVRQEQENTRVKSLLARMDEEKASIVNNVDEKEKLTLTLGYPGSPEIGIWYSMILFFHLEYSTEEVGRRLAQYSKKEHQQFAEAKKPIRALRGTYFRIEPKVDGVVFNPASMEIAWIEDLQEANFRFSVKEGVAATSLLGRVQLSVEGFEVASIAVSMTIGGGSWVKEDDPWDLSTVELHQQVFASYAREDAPIIDTCRSVYNGLGIYLFVDKFDLLAGQEWHPALKSKISSSDAFMLFWSEKSKLSINVRKEWEAALEVQKKKGSPYFIYPIYWEIPKPSVPEELRHLNFRQLEFKQQQPTNTNIGNQHTGVKLPDQFTHSINVNPTVLPFIQGESRSSIACWRSFVSNAVNFLENITGLRYYPLPTFLVDKLAVRTIRTVQHIVDGPGVEDVESREGWIGILRNLLSEFHTRRVPPFIDGDIADEETLPVAMHVLTELKELAEGRFGYWMWRVDHFPGDEGVFENRSELLPVDFFEKMKAILEKIRSQIDIRRPYLQQEFSITLSSSERPISSSINEYRCWQHISKSYKGYGIKSEKQNSIRNYKDNHQLTATGFTWVSMLNDLISKLIEKLDEHHKDEYSDSQEQVDYEALGYVLMIEAIAGELDIPIIHPLKKSIFEFIYPSWRRVRDWMVAEDVNGFKKDANFNSFLNAFFDIIKGIFNDSLASYKSIPWLQYYKFEEAGWNIIQSQYTGISDLAIIYSNNKPDRIEGDFSQYLRLFEVAVRHVLQKPNPAAAVVMESALFGAYVPEGNDQADLPLLTWAAKHHISQQMILPESAKVLFCTRDINQEDAAINSLLQQCVLVHEHFHAILEKGIDPNGNTANLLNWQAAMPLNESLAVWTELYYLAQLGDSVIIEKVQQAMHAYITHGDYPSWPYRGAEKVMRIFEKGGLKAVVELIHSLRQDAVATQKAFDLA